MTQTRCKADLRAAHLCDLVNAPYMVMDLSSGWEPAKEGVSRFSMAQRDLPEEV